MYIYTYVYIYVCVCVWCVCARACVRACVRARACVGACVRACVRVCEKERESEREKERAIRQIFVILNEGCWAHAFLFEQEARHRLEFDLSVCLNQTFVRPILARRRHVGGT